METEKKHPFQALAKAINEDPEYQGTPLTWAPRIGAEEPEEGDE